MDGQPFDAHCTPLNVAATLGLPALAGFALIPFALWRSRSRPLDRATWGMLAGLALDALGQDVEITLRPTRKKHGEVSLVA